MLYIIRIGLHEQCEGVDQPTNSEKPNGQQIEDTHTGFAFIELMCTQIAEEKAQQEGNPFVAFPAALTANVDTVNVGIRIIDYDVGLCCLLLNDLYLTATVRTHNCGRGDLLTAVFAVFHVGLLHYAIPPCSYGTWNFLPCYCI